MNGKKIETEDINNTEEHLQEKKDEGNLFGTKSNCDVYILGKSENFLRKIRGY